MNRGTKGVWVVGNLKGQDGNSPNFHVRGSVTRSNTVDTPFGNPIPIIAVPVRIWVWTNVNSDAGTSAALAIGKSGADTYFIAAQGVKSGSLTINIPTLVVSANLFTAMGTGGADLQLVAKYTETGTASTTGGPFFIDVEYYIP